MAVEELTVFTVPFQGSFNMVDDLEAVADEMEFINDGYTFLYVLNTEDAMGSSTTVTITGVRDNAGRSKTLTQTVGVSNGSYVFGPFRPTWWNDQGKVGVSFSSTTNVFAQAVKLQF